MEKKKIVRKVRHSIVVGFCSLLMSNYMYAFGSSTPSGYDVLPLTFCHFIRVHFFLLYAHIIFIIFGGCREEKQRNFRSK